MAGLWAKYNIALAAQPLLTKSATVSFLSGFGDWLVQNIQSRGEGKWSHDWARTGKMCFYGAFVVAPLNHYWYKILDRVVRPGRDLGFFGNSANYKKLALDQLFFAPIIISAFFVSMTFLNGKGPKEAVERIKRDIVPTLKLNYCLWPAAQFINFTFVPPQHRVGYVSIVVMFWSCLLSWSANTKPKDS